MLKKALHLALIAIAWSGLFCVTVVLPGFLVVFGLALVFGAKTVNSYASILAFVVSFPLGVLHQILWGRIRETRRNYSRISREDGDGNRRG